MASLLLLLGVLCLAYRVALPSTFSTNVGDQDDQESIRLMLPLVLCYSTLTKQAQDLFTPLEGLLIIPQQNGRSMSVSQWNKKTTPPNEKR